jgi:hypothetical protein
VIRKSKKEGIILVRLKKHSRANCKKEDSNFYGPKVRAGGKNLQSCVPDGDDAGGTPPRDAAGRRIGAPAAAAAHPFLLDLFFFGSPSSWSWRRPNKRFAWGRRQRLLESGRDSVRKFGVGENRTDLAY